jgi:hypothetical protein
VRSCKLVRTVLAECLGSKEHKKLGFTAFQSSLLVWNMSKLSHQHWALPQRILASLCPFLLSSQVAMLVAISTHPRVGGRWWCPCFCQHRIVANLWTFWGNGEPSKHLVCHCSVGWSSFSVWLVLSCSMIVHCGTAGTSGISRIEGWQGEVRVLAFSLGRQWVWDFSGLVFFRLFCQLFF